MDPQIIARLQYDPVQNLKLPKLDYVQINKLPHDLQISQDEEFDYIEEYEKKMSPQKKKREEDEKQRRERLQKKQEEIRIRVEEQKKKDMQMLDVQFSQQLMEEEKKQFEVQKQDRQKSEQQEYMILQVITQYPNVDFDMAKMLLTSSNWNMNEVMEILGEQFKQEEQSQENTIKNLQQEFKDIDEDMIRNILKKNNWNYQAAQKELRQNMISITYSMLGPNNNQQETLRGEFLLDDDGMQLIRYLQNNRPAVNQYYLLYKDFQCTRFISYIDLTNSIRQLNILNNSTLYVKKTYDPPF